MQLVAIKRSKVVASLAIPSVALLFSLIVLSTHAIQLYGQKLATAITFDLIITLPLLNLYLFRKNASAKYISSLLFTVGIIAAGFIIPKTEQAALHLIKVWLTPAVEVVVMFLLIRKVNTVVKDQRSAGKNLDFYNSLKSTLTKLFPPFAANVLAVEIAVFYYLFVDWKKVTYDGNNFSYHKKSGSIALLLVLVFIVIIETSAVHLLLAKWSELVAWILTGVSIYLAFQIFGLVKSMLKRPIRLSQNCVHICYGIFADASFDILDISHIEKSTKDIVGRQPLYLSPLKKFEGQNTIIFLRKPCTAKLLYGKTKVFDTLFLHIDENVQFMQEIDARKLKLEERR